MSNLIIVPNKKENINTILDKNVDGIIIGVNNLSIYELNLDIDEIISIASNTSKRVIIAINKMIHNSDLPVVKDILLKIKDTNIYGIITYDLGIANLIKKLKINKEIILSEEHLNSSTLSNNFYYDNGITSSYITSDITKDEILNIKKNTKMNMYYTIYGYLPIFYSRRYLLTNYFKYIDKVKESNKYYIFDKDLRYTVIEKEFGTIIYSPLINLINHKEELNDIDDLVIDLSYIDDINIIDDYLNNRKFTDAYEGFFNTKTIYKLKGDNNE